MKRDNFGSISAWRRLVRKARAMQRKHPTNPLLYSLYWYARGDRSERLFKKLEELI